MLVDAQEQHTLLLVAERVIGHGMATGTVLAVALEEFALRLQQPGASFVSLHRHRELRGCIGSLEPQRPLVQDVAANAYAAAFRDPRFPPLLAEEWEGLDLEVSLLSPAEPIDAGSEAELLQRLRPHEDGLILEESHCRATFLPAVWRSLPDPRHFLRQLKLKAGLPHDYWSDTIRFCRYRTESFSRPVGALADDR